MSSTLNSDTGDVSVSEKNKAAWAKAFINRVFSKQDEKNDITRDSFIKIKYNGKIKQFWFLAKKEEQPNSLKEFLNKSLNT